MRSWSFSNTRGHARQERGAHAREVPSDGVERLGKDHGDARQQVDVGDRPLERVAEREERQRHVLLGQLQHVRAGLDVRDEIGVRQHDALGLARRARGVDDRRELVGPHGARAVAELPARPPLARQACMTTFGNGLERHDRRTVARRPAVHQDDGLERRQLVPDVLDLLELQPRRDDRRLRARVVQDVTRLRRRERRVNRHRDRCPGQDRQVGLQPLGPALGDNRDAVARRDPERPQPERQVPDALEEFLARQLVDPVRPAAADQFRILEPARDVKRQVGDRLEVDGGDFILTRRRGGGRHAGDYTRGLAARGWLLAGSRLRAQAQGSGLRAQADLRPDTRRFCLSLEP